MEWLSSLQAVSPDVELLPPAGTAVIAEAEHLLGELPGELKDVLARANGLVCRSFRLLSAFDRDQPKKTWESLQRANDPSTTRALGGDPDLLARFLVFADIGGGFAAWDRVQGSIWFEEAHDEELCHTDLSLSEFVETMVRNAE
jgi:hypothetical protein